MDSLVILVAGIFLDFGAALMLIVPVVRFSVVTTHISKIQQELLELIPMIFRNDIIDKETSRVESDIQFEFNKDREEMKVLARQTRRYEKRIFPYGITFLGIGFVFIVIGTMWGAINHLTLHV